MSVLNDIEQDCGVCGRLLADHTLREFRDCQDTKTYELPYEDLDGYQRELAGRMGLPDGSIVADHVTAKALVMDAGVTKAPLVLLEFSSSPRVGEITARIAFVGDQTTIRAFGRLIRDTSNGAANAAERAA